MPGQPWLARHPIVCGVGDAMPAPIRHSGQGEIYRGTLFDLDKSDDPASFGNQVNFPHRGFDPGSEDGIALGAQV